MDWKVMLAILCLTVPMTSATTTESPSSLVPEDLSTNTAPPRSTAPLDLTLNTAPPESTAPLGLTLNTAPPKSTAPLGLTLNTAPPRSTAPLDLTLNTAPPSSTAPLDVTLNTAPASSTAPLDVTLDTTPPSSTAPLDSTPSTAPLSSTTPLTSTASTAPPAASFSLIFSINEIFVPQLADTNSPEFAQKAAKIIKEVGQLYKSFKNFIRMEIRKFRNGSIVTESSLLFSSNGPNIDVTQVVNTFSNGLNTLTFKVDPQSIEVIQTLAAAQVASSFILTFSINQTFVPQLADTNSAQFVQQAESIIKEVGPLYKIFKNFIRMEIQKFKNGSIVTESRLLFSSDGPNINVAQVINTFSNGLITLTFSVDPNSIRVTQDFGAKVAALFSLTFSINETFVSELANTDSQQFTTKSASIRNEVEPIFRNNFTNFIRMQILTFRNGSVVTDGFVFFSSEGRTVNVTGVKNTFLNGLSILTFKVDPNSVIVTQIFGNSMPPVIASSLSMIWMSLLLSMALQF